MKSKTLVVLALSLSIATAFAQSEEQVLNADPINVDGYLHEKQVTDRELEEIKSEIRNQKNQVQLNKEKSKSFKELSKTTEKLSDVTEEYIDEKKSSLKDIAEYNKKIKCLMEENPGPECAKYVRNRKPVEQPVVQEIKQAQAAPVVSTAEVAAPVEMSDVPFETIKMGLDAGVINYTSENEELRADTIGVRIEGNLSRRFTMSVGANYSSFKTEDFGNIGMNQPWSGQYYSAYGAQGREIDYKKFGLEFGAKFFISQSERFRPYVGVGVGYNMANLRYNDNDSQSFGANSNFGNEQYKTNFATGSLALGTEVMITRTLGINVQGAFSTGLGDSLSSESNRNRATNPDQQRLTELGNEVINSRALSLTGGLLMIF